MGSLPIRPLPGTMTLPVAPPPPAVYTPVPSPGLPPGALPNPIASAPSNPLPNAKPRPMPRSYAPEISPALSDFIDFQTMMASSRYLHLKEKKRVSVAKTSFLSAMLSAGLTTASVILSAINGQSEKVFLIPILGILGAAYGALLGLLINHDQQDD